ncbi:MAG: hydrogenase expression/formation protein HypE [Planctomycetes bacterium]|nr:hydrogenase expression/formation protein HypE [Planctomycetota bacterium]
MSDGRADFGRMSCPRPGHPDRVLLGHGGGGTMTRDLVREIFLPAIDNDFLGQRHDGAVFSYRGERFATTTDGFVARPMVFPGGDLGKLAVCGTVNDLAMCGARPLQLTAGFIIEEGTDFELLRRLARSLGETARAAEVAIGAADTKVVERGSGDGVFVVTSGFGLCLSDHLIGPAALRSGDAIILSGDLGRHGVTMLVARDELGLETALESDCALLHEPALALVAAGLEVHVLRDLTRGGLSAALVEIAEDAALHLVVDEASVAVAPEVRGACELLGLDPFQVANEGRFICCLPASQVGAALAVLAAFPVTASAAVIGEVEAGPAGRVSLAGGLGARRLLQMPSGELLPRIC